MKYVKTIQGTDGVRGMITHTAKSHPFFDFINTGYVSPPFFEFYAYVFCLYLLRTEEIKEKIILIATDNRDPDGSFLEHASHGCAAAGFDVVTMGVLPTPAVPLLMKKYKADAGIMLTASHNPATYHGIKLFLGDSGLKLDKDQEEEFTQYMYYFSEYPVPTWSDATIADYHEDAVDYFFRFHKTYCASIAPKTNAVHLFLDCANGAFSETAERIFKEMRFKSITTVNHNIEKKINTGGGAAVFEHLDVITYENYQTNPSLRSLKILGKIFNKTKKNITSQSRQKNKTEKYIGIVFDGDGDRCVCLVYNPYDTSIYVLTGDALAALIVKNLIAQGKTNIKLFTTVESDLMISEILPVGTHSMEKTSVGDRWLTYKILEFMAEPYFDGQTVIGYEDSGHMIFPVPLPDNRGVLLCGNGLISGVHFLKALSGLEDRFDKDQIHEILSPYEKGIKETIGIYNTDKYKLNIGQPERNALEKYLEGIGKKLKKQGYSTGQLFFPAEPEMIYFAFFGKTERGVVFVRNSGTENKTSVYIRGCANARETLREIGDELRLFLHLHMKNYRIPPNAKILQCLKDIHAAKDGELAIMRIRLDKETVNNLLDNEKLIHRLSDTTVTLTQSGQNLLNGLLEQEATAASKTTEKFVEKTLN